MARYLIEPKEEEEVTYSIYMKNDNPIIQKHFLDAIGQYNVYTGYEKGVVHNTIRKAIQNNKSQIISFLQEI